MLKLDIDYEMIMYTIYYPDFVSVGFDDYGLYIKYFEGYILGVITRKIDSILEILSAQWIVYPREIGVLH